MAPSTTILCTSHIMSTVLMKPSFPFTLLSILLLFPTFLHAKNQPTYAKVLSPNTLGLKNEKLTQFRVYWHDILGGPNATAIRITPPVKKSINGFGILTMIDDALTMGPELNSKLIGRAQGLYAAAAQGEVGLMMVMNFAFMKGKYNGSTISILGRNTVFSKVREMPIIGGSGLFRFASGYVQARTHTFDPTNGDATVEYNCYVRHY